MTIELSDAAASKMLEQASRLMEQALTGSATSKAYGESTHIGKAVFIRTVTFHYVGTLVRENASWLTLKDASWVADSGRWSDALSTGKLNEVEPFPDGEIDIARDTIVDVSAWSHEVPRTQK